MGKGFFKFWPHKDIQQSETLIKDYQEVFGSEEGKRVLADILAQSGYFQVTKDGGNLDRSEGKREIAHHIYNLVNLSEKHKSAIYNLARAEYAAKERNSNG